MAQTLKLAVDAEGAKAAILASVRGLPRSSREAVRDASPALEYQRGWVADVDVHSEWAAMFRYTSTGRGSSVGSLFAQHPTYRSFHFHQNMQAPLTGDHDRTLRHVLVRADPRSGTPEILTGEATEFELGLDPAIAHLPGLDAAAARQVIVDHATRLEKQSVARLMPDRPATLRTAVEIRDLALEETLVPVWVVTIPDRGKGVWTFYVDGATGRVHAPDIRSFATRHGCLVAMGVISSLAVALFLLLVLLVAIGPKAQVPPSALAAPTSSPSPHATPTRTPKPSPKRTPASSR